MVHSLTACGGFNRANRVPGREQGEQEAKRAAGREEGPRARGNCLAKEVGNWTLDSQVLSGIRCGLPVFATRPAGCITSVEKDRINGAMVSRMSLWICWHIQRLECFEQQVVRKASLSHQRGPMSPMINSAP